MADFDYSLPDAAIAQTPAEPRPSARMLVAVDPGGPPAHRCVADLADLVGPGDLLVLNETRVIPARLALRKATGGAAEVLLLEPDPDRGAGWWQALVKPGRRLPPGSRLCGAGGLAVEVGDRLAGGRRAVLLSPPPGQAEADAIAAAGEVALPPYIHEPLADPDRYQTVYAASPGSVAAPTAGLHLTDEVLAACRDAGATVATVDLVVGLDTFRPITASRWADHVMHSERYAVPVETMAACRAASRVIAVGTTTVRALESAAATGRKAAPTSSSPRGSRSGWSTCWSPTSTCRARRCCCCLRRSRATAGATCTTSRWPRGTGSCRSATP
jgi:S-adenosylmethionine:tRNA ribosyltransferase-isomerase